MRRWLLALPFLLSALSILPAQAQPGPWSCAYNFRNGLQGWTITTGSLVQGQYITSAYVFPHEQLEIRLPARVEVNDVRLYFEVGIPVDIILLDGTAVFETSLGSDAFEPGSNIYQWTKSEVIENGSIGIRFEGRNLLEGGLVHLSQVYIAGFGATPCEYPGVPQPDPIDIDGGGLNSALMSGNASLAGLPADLDTGVPAETGRTLFGYAKWIFSPSSADEIAGPIAPMVSHAGIGFSVIFSMALVYGIVWAAIWLIRFAIFIFRLIMEFIQTVVSVIGSVLRFFI